MNTIKVKYTAPAQEIISLEEVCPLASSGETELPGLEQQLQDGELISDPTLIL